MSEITITLYPKKSEVCLVSFASKGREDYNKGMYRLMESTAAHWKCDSIFFSLDSIHTSWAGLPIRIGTPEGYQPHNVTPYQFKVACVNIARKEGYKKILWLDSTMVVARDPLPLLDECEKGVMAFDCLGHPLYKYISDTACRLLGVTEPEIKEIQQCWGGAFMLDFNKETACAVWSDIVRASNTPGIFQDGISHREGFVAHRHDQAAMSVVFWKHFIPLQPYGKILGKIHNVPPYEFGSEPYIIYG